MPIFKYIARSRSGEKVDGTVEANDKRTALLQIERMGHVPMSVTEAGAGAGGAKKSKKASREKKISVEARPGRKVRIKLHDLLLLSRELSDLLSSGMTLGNALNTLSRRQTGKAQDKIVADLRDEIVQGSNLSDALAKRPESFPSLYVSMVRAGEASGALAHSLENLCMHYERVQEARDKVVMALIYPCIVLIIGLATVVFSMVFVVPRFTSIFEELGSTLPLPTQILISGSNVLIHYGWAVAIGLVVVGILIRRALKTENGRRWWHRRQLKLPIVKNIVNANAFAHFARTLGALLRNGVPVLKALSIVEDTVGNVVIAEEIHDARDRVTDGATISEPLAAGKIFPSLLTDMLAVGEESGDMSGALSHIARRYDDELDRAVKVFTSVLEPILIVVMAVLVGFLAISMLLAVFDLTSGLSI